MMNVLLKIEEVLVYFAVLKRAYLKLMKENVMEENGIM